MVRNKCCKFFVTLWTIFSWKFVSKIAVKIIFINVSYVKKLFCIKFNDGCFALELKSYVCELMLVSTKKLRILKSLESTFSPKVLKPNIIIAHLRNRAYFYNFAMAVFVKE